MRVQFRASRELRVAATADDCYLRPVASPPDTGPRHVGRVVDELGREEGDTEDLVGDDLSSSPPPDAAVDPLEPSSQRSPDPEAEIEVESADSGKSEPADDPSTLTPSDTPPADSTAADPHPVRERLLAKAAAVRHTGISGAAPTSSPASELDAIGRDLGQRPKDVELDLSPRQGTRPPSAPALGRGRRQMSPTWLAVFGTLLGLATIASLVALMLAIDPRQQQVAAAAVSSTPEPTPPSAQSAPAKPQVKKRARQKIPGPWRIADTKGDATLRLIEGKIGLLPFLRAVQEAGIKTEQAYRLVTALKDHRNLDKCSKTDRFQALVERSSSRVKAFEYSASEEEIYQVREGSDGLLVGRKLDLKVARAQVQGAFVYEGGSFDAAAERGGFDPGLAKVMIKTLDGHSGLDELSRGDRVRVIAQEVTVLGDFARYAGVEAVEIVPADSSQKPFRLYYFQGPESRGYFDDKGKQPYEGGWRKPIKDAQMTSPFNPKRLHPILKKVMPHNGIDFAAPPGTPVGASAFGTVSYIGYAGASGNLVKIEHPSGIETGYAHLQRFAEGLKLGDKVKRLQLIGYVGSTGRSTGPHLHFSAEKDQQFIDPQTLNLDGMRTLTGPERGLFAQVKQNYDRLLDAIALPEPLAPEPVPTPATSVALDPGAEETEAPEPVLPPGPAAPAPTPARPGAAPTPATQPAAARGSGAANPIYLTDDELLKMQGTSDDGEVAE